MYSLYKYLHAYVHIVSRAENKGETYMLREIGNVGDMKEGEAHGETNRVEEGQGMKKRWK